jgi:hypothetical protein
MFHAIDIFLFRATTYGRNRPSTGDILHQNKTDQKPGRTKEVHSASSGAETGIIADDWLSFSHAAQTA